MIKLTRLDGEPFVLNAELIRYVERRPDTFITLTSGERIVVRETLDEVVDLAVKYQQHKHFMPSPTVALRPEIGIANGQPSKSDPCLDNTANT
ncbi:flagellar FlbD family protein [Novipirellula artificiosorum]|uniref:Flagellar protein (FlbD) n=1 Tax=Novipirellula artificiosorum TaxID=2528016 RepID=A0A5C6D650_9BACT|nr:flagellar FlbD family protein [Novipirellula artificiosorum]TWU31535.1 Flagellar protein (FlbD) [Novipirellula artificiosorum]